MRDASLPAAERSIRGVRGCRAMGPDVALKETPLRAVHEAAGAKLGPFAGWRMPIEYEGTLAEHRAVRERVGLFDLTHLGKVEAVGPGAAGLLQGVVTNDVAAIPVGEAQYNLVLNEGGGVIEDLIVYRLGGERYFVVPNASNTQRVLQILGEADAPDRVHLLYHQDWFFMAIQGPDAPQVVRALFPGTEDLGFMQCVEADYRRRPVIVTRSGYTGEVGYELFTYEDIAEDLWRDVEEAAKPFDGRPCGLAARDVLRLEMGYPLYGQDLFETTTAFEAGLAWAVAMDKGPFRGRGGLERQREEGLPSRLRGLRMDERRSIPRSGYPVFLEDRVVGEVTSGTFSPLLQTGIGLGYLWPADVAGIGDVLEVDIRGRRAQATVTRPPFVDRDPRG
jgi:glycine cleavage system T protein (aminomethyltransferase)